MLTRLPVFGSGSQKSLPDVKSALEQLARRILSCPDDSFEPSPPPALLKTLTDELLVVASDAVAAVAAEVQPPPSGKAQLRLLAWLAADARGANAVLDNATAWKAGKRIDYQAQAVRAALAQATRTAEEERAALAEAGARMSAAEVSKARAKIDEKEQQTYDKHRREVYIGFHELEDLLPRPVPAVVSQPRFPHLLPQANQRATRPLPPIPPDLTAVLDAAACSEICERFGHRDAHNYDDDPEAHVWWTQILPDYVDELRAERDELRAEWERVVRSREEVRRQRDAAVADRVAAEEERDAAVEARDAAVDEECVANMRVVSVQQSQQRRINLYCARIEELEAEKERMIKHMIS